VVFLAVGFETTVPNVAATLTEAEESDVRNFFALVAHKLIPPAMRALLDAPDVVVTGFEPFDILQAICMLVEQKLEGAHRVEVQYRRAVRAGGNPRARAIMNQVFEPVDADWRGLGRIPDSGLNLKPAFSRFDAEAHLGITVEAGRDHPECRCGDVLRGVIEPTECRLFGHACTPRQAIGPCMVSSEGTCAAYFKYGK